MADEISTDDINTAAQAAKLALLNRIAEQAPRHNSAASLQGLAYAYALTVGAAHTYLPGTPISIDSK